MKIICAWCGKVIRDGPEEPVSHGVCEECVIVVFNPEKENDDPPAQDCSEMTAWLMKCTFWGSLIFNLLLLAIVLLTELLHFLTRGWFPSFLK